MKYMVKEVVLTQKGKINVQFYLGGGISFVIEIPNGATQVT